MKKKARKARGKMRIRPQPTDFLNQSELADRWGMSVRTLERWRYVNQGPSYIKLGGRVAYAIRDIIAFEQMQRVP